MKIRYQIMKSELKAQAIKIRLMKSKRGPSNSGYVHGLERESHLYRHKHIAYCLLRGRQYKDIEPKVNPGNEPDMDLVNSFQKVVLGEETVCAS